MKNKQLILSLIKDDLINTKLMHGLIDVGLNAENYFLCLSETIFKLMGFEDNEARELVFERYVQLSKKAAFIDITISHKPLEGLVNEIYEELCKQKMID
jgi:hypothetical protein